MRFALVRTSANRMVKIRTSAFVFALQSKPVQKKRQNQNQCKKKRTSTKNMVKIRTTVQKNALVQIQRASSANLHWRPSGFALVRFFAL